VEVTIRPIRDNTVLQIEITNACHLSCQNCTRHVGHHRQPYFMEVDYFAKAVASIIESPCRIGVMGGEPALHPKFKDILAIVRDMVPPERREFWTAGFKWGDHKSDIQDTFQAHLIHFNDHISYDGKHKPLLVAIDEVIDDPELKKQLIDNCPYQTHWSASITPKGGFFCEIAASLDWLFDGPGGYDIEDSRWWDKDPADFQDQVAEYCGKCSGAIPQPPLPLASDARGGRDAVNQDMMTEGNMLRLMEIGSPKVARGGFTLWKGGKITADDIPDDPRNPREYRSFEAHDPADIPDATNL
jgi:hypothetical protein